MLEKPRIVQSAAQPTVIIGLTVPRDEIQEAMEPGHQELVAAVDAQGIATTGPWFTHHLRMDPEVFDSEIGVLVAASPRPVGRVTASRLPAAAVARAVYSGPYEGLGEARGELDAWVVAEGHTPAPDLWEFYVLGPESSSDPAS